MSFFKNMPGNLDFQLYDFNHIAAIIAVLVFSVLIIYFRKKLRNPKIDRIIRMSATILVFSMEIIFHISNYYYDTDFILYVVPFHLCSLTFWLAIAVNLTKSKFLFNLLYFWAVGAIVTFVYPDIIGIGPDTLRFYQFFGNHGYIFLTVVYFIAVFGYRINFKSFLYASGTLLPITLIVRTVDFHFYDTYKSNWMYLVTPPDMDTILNAFPTQGWPYYFSLLFLGTIFFLIAYLPWGILAWRKAKSPHLYRYNSHD